MHDRDLEPGSVSRSAGQIRETEPRKKVWIRQFGFAKFTAIPGRKSRRFYITLATVISKFLMRPVGLELLNCNDFKFLQYISGEKKPQHGRRATHSIRERL